MAGQRRVLGLAGAIGAGKSTVAREFERQGCLVISSDELNRRVLARPEVAATLREWWGEDVLDAEGVPRRDRLAEIVFADPAQRERLEALTHPLIAAERRAIIQSTSDLAATIVILDSPLLFETNLDRECDEVVFVDASESQRLERLRSSRGWDAAELRSRERWQMPPGDKRSRSTFVIANDGSPDDLRSQVAAILRQLDAVE